MKKTDNTHAAIASLIKSYNDTLDKILFDLLEQINIKTRDPQFIKSWIKRKGYTLTRMSDGTYTWFELEKKNKKIMSEFVYAKPLDYFKKIDDDLV